MKNITVYSTPTCPWCTRVKDYLSRKEMKFNDINVATNREAAFEMIKKSGQRGVPVIDIDGTIVIGFDQTKIDSLIS